MLENCSRRKTSEAIQVIAAEVRENPTDAKRRTFLFELLCFAGDYDRAEKHLHVLSQSGPNTEMGALLYRGVLHGERARGRRRSRTVSTRTCRKRTPPLSPAH